MKVVKEQILSSHHKENYCLFCFFNAVSIWDERWLPDLLWSSLHDISLCCPPWTYTVPPVNYISIKLEGKHFWSIRLLPETMPLLTKKCLLEENNRCIQHADTSRETLLVWGLPSWPQAGANGVVKEGRSSKLDKLRACEEDWVKSSKKACSLYVWGFSGTPSRFVLSSLTIVSWQILFLFFFSGCFAWFAGTCFPDQGLNPGPQQWEHWVLTTGLPGNSPSLLLEINLYFGKKHSFSCSRLIGTIVVRTTLITHWVVHHGFIYHLMEHSKWAYMIITVLVPSLPFSQ